MKKITYLIICLTAFSLFAKAQTSSGTEFYNKDFNWSITIPEGFEPMDSKEWKKMQNKGKDAIDNTFEVDIEINTKNIFIFKSDQYNYFESLYQPNSSITEAEYLESVIAVNSLIYETFATQMPDMEIDSAFSEEIIDNLRFYKNIITLNFPNGWIMKTISYTRLFGKKELCVNIMYINEEKGKLLLDAWRKSTFSGKK